MKISNSLNTTLLPLSILISSFISGEAMATTARINPLLFTPQPQSVNTATGDFERVASGGSFCLGCYDEDDSNVINQVNDLTKNSAVNPEMAEKAKIALQAKFEAEKAQAVLKAAEQNKNAKQAAFEHAENEKKRIESAFVLLTTQHSMLEDQITKLTTEADVKTNTNPDYYLTDIEKLHQIIYKSSTDDRIKSIQNDIKQKQAEIENLAKIAEDKLNLFLTARAPANELQIKVGTGQFALEKAVKNAEGTLSLAQSRPNNTAGIRQAQAALTSAQQALATINQQIAPLQNIAYDAEVLSTEANEDRERAKIHLEALENKLTDITKTIVLPTETKEAAAKLETLNKLVAAIRTAEKSAYSIRELNENGAINNLNDAKKEKDAAEKEYAAQQQRVKEALKQLAAHNDAVPTIAKKVDKESNQKVKDGNFALDTKVAGGTQDVEANSAVAGSQVTENGTMNLAASGISLNAQVEDGTLNNNGGTDTGSTISAAGQYALKGTQDNMAESVDAIIEEQGIATLDEFSKVKNMTTRGMVTAKGGSISLGSVIKGGEYKLESGATAENTHVYGGDFVVGEGATAYNTVVNGGQYNLQNGGQATELTVAQGIAQIAGKLNNMTLDGGHAVLAQTAEITGAIKAAAGSVIVAEHGANTGDVDLELAGNFELSADDMAPEYKLPTRAVRSVSGSVGNVTPSTFALGNVDLKGGNVDLSKTPNTQLTMKSLAGKGTINLGAAQQQASAAPLKVTGDASGEFIINMNGSGVAPSNLDVIETSSGDARFALAGDSIELGNYKHTLARNANGSVGLVADKTALSASTAGILAVANTTPVIFNAELSSIQQRLDAQNTQANASGIWMSYLGNNFAVKGRAANFTQTLGGLTLGGDKAIELGEGVLSIGGFVSSGSSSIKTDYQSTGNVESRSLGGYVQYLTHSGYFANAVMKGNMFKQKMDITSADTRASGNTDFSGMGAAVKVGKHITYNDVFISPYVAMSTFSTGNNDVTLSNGMTAQSSNTRSAIGTFGANAGYRVVLNNGVEMKPYISASVESEFAKNNQVKVNGEAFDNNLNGMRINGGVGMNVNLTTNFSINSEVKFSSGKNLKAPTTLNLGVAYAF